MINLSCETCAKPCIKKQKNIFLIHRNLPGWAEELGIYTWAQFFLKFILSNSSATCVIPGTSNPNHLLQNIQAGNGLFPDEKTRKKMLDYFIGK
jgi:aryl-alcohol dehydrogenase-like predicted oxidoreductase